MKLRKVLSLLVAVVMIIGTLPASAIATELTESSEPAITSVCGGVDEPAVSIESITVDATDDPSGSVVSIAEAPVGLTVTSVGESAPATIAEEPGSEQNTVVSDTGIGTVSVYNAQVWVTHDGTTYNLNSSTDPVTVADGDLVTVSFEWYIVNNVVDSYGNKVLTYTADLNELGLFAVDVTTPTALYSGNEYIGTYTIIDGILTIYLDETATQNKSNIGGGAIIEGTIDLDADDTVADGSEQVVGIVDKTFTVLYDSNSPDGVVTVVKTTTGDVQYDDANYYYYQDYSITVTVSGIMSDITMTDILPAGLEYIDGSLTATADAVVSYDNGTITATFPDGTTKHSSSSYVITYRAKITDDAMAAGDGIENTATISYTDPIDGPESVDSTATVTPPTDTGVVTIAKNPSGSISYDDTNGYFYQDYTIAVIVEGTVSDISISDVLPSDEALVSGTLAVKDSNDNPVSDATVDEQTMTILLPDHVGDDVAYYFITYRATITEEAILNGTSLANTATVTYKDPDGVDQTDEDQATITPVAPSIKKTGSYDGVYQSLSAFDWEVVIDFGTYGLSLSDDDINEILKTITDNAYYNNGNPITPTAPTDADGNFTQAAVILGGFSSGYITLDMLEPNADGSYTINYSASYNFADTGVSISTVENVIGIVIGDKPLTVTGVVEVDFIDISLDKSTSLDPNSPYYKDTNASFANEYITYSESIEDYESGGTHYKKFTVTITTPSNIPTSNVDVTLTLDDGLKYSSMGTTLLKGGTTVGLRMLPIPDAETQVYWWKVSYYVETNTSIGGYDNVDYSYLYLTICAEPGTTYTLTYYAEIEDYEDGTDYSSLGDTVELDYDLEIPYTLTLDLTGMEKGGSNLENLRSSFESLVFSDTLISKNTYFIDWAEGESITVDGTNLSYILRGGTLNGVDYYDSKYDTVREFIKNFTVTVGGTEYNLISNSSFAVYMLSYGTLEISRYSWTFTIEYNYSVFQQLFYRYFTSTYSTDFDKILVSYNAVQDSYYLGNTAASSVTVYNSATASLNYDGSSATDRDSETLSITNTDYIDVNKSYWDELDLGGTTYTYTYDNHIGWSVRIYSSGGFAAGDTVVITDTLPEKLSYDISAGDYVMYLSNNTSSSPSSYRDISEFGTVNVAYDDATRTITFTVRITAATSLRYLIVYFQTDIDDDYYAIMTSTDGIYRFSNTATGTMNGFSQSASTTKIVQNTVSDPITKELLAVEKDNSKYGIVASYSIAVNPNGGDYNDSGTTIDILDTLPDSFVLDESSVTAVDDSGNAVSITTVYDTATNEITFTIPDDINVIITYEVTISVNELSDPTWYSNSTNTAKILGGYYEGKESAVAITSADYAITVWAYESDGSVTIYKYWEDSGIDTDLAGATFSIYTVYDNNGKWYASGDSGYMAGTVKTDSDGAATFSGLALDRIYKVVEINAPDGFLTADEFYVVLQGYDGVVIPEEIKNSGLRIVEVAFSNDSEPIEILDDECVDITVSKVWDDDDNRDGLRPDEVTVSLLANGEVYDTVTLTEADDWEYTWDGVLPKYDDSGVEIIYTVAEVDDDNISTVPTDYDATINGYEITNTHEIETTEIKVTKTWNDDDNRDGIRPTSITVTLTGSDGNTYTADLTKDNNWEYTFTDLPVYWNEGTEIEYTLNEVAVEGYTVTEDDFALTNTHEIETTEIKVTKTWDDDGNRDGIRPETITVTLTGSDGNTYTADLTKDNDWEYTFTDLPVYWNEGTEIEYTLNEVAVEGYTVTEDDFALTNTHEIETTEIKVTKAWDDDDNRDGIRPASITVTLTGSDGNTYTADLTKDNNWEYTFTDLPVYWNEGTTIEYDLNEVAVEGYTVTEDDFALTNTHEIETTEIKVTKAWDDDDNRDGIRPASITVTLTGSDGNTYTADLTKDNNWEYTFTDLPVYWNEGTTIEYDLNEVAVEGYTVTEDDFALTNTHEIETTEIKVTKTWDDDDNRDGIRPETITVTLTGSDGNTYTADLTKDNDWEYTFTDLPVYWNEGTEIEYTLNEVAVEGYTVTEDDFALTNTHEIETTEIKVTKTWDDDDNRDGIRPETITVTLTGSDGNTYTADLTKDNNWEYTFTDLPVYWNEGTEIEYTLNEVAVEGYTVTEDDFALTNTHEIETTEIKVTKAWDDDDNRDGIRPASITVTLTGSDGNTYTADLTKDNNWEYTFTDLPVYWNEGTEIEYTLNEVAVEGYTVTEDDFALTNTHEIETTEIKVTKAWDDDDNRDGIRPETITVTLTGSDGNTYTADLTKDNNWEYTFTDLPVYWNEGTTIEYTLEESEIEEYTGEITAVEGGFEVTNTHAPYTTEVSVIKVWDDAGNYDYIRPTGITVVLLGDGTEVETAELNEDNGWAYTFTDLYVNSEGEAITYTVEEVSVSGYTSEITGDAESGYVVTNTHTPDFSPSLSYTSVTVTKVWNDDNDSDGVRPASVTVVLYQDGVATGRSVTLSAANNWTASFTGLLATNGNTVYTYSVGEANVPENYTATVSGNGYSFTITNTYTPVVEIEEPIESTDTDDEEDTDDLEVQEESETTDANPTTGIVLSLLPMAVIALAAVSVKRR